MTHDSRVEFRARDDGPYRIRIRDKRRDGGPGFVYRIEVEQPRTSLTLFLAGSVRKSQSGQVIAVPRGNRVIAYLGVRRDGFDGPVRVEPGPLPDGVSLDLQEIPAATYLTPVVFEAAADAPLGASLVELRGRASTPGGTVTGGFQQVVNLVPGSGDSSYQSLTVDKLAVVVTEEAPYQVSLDAPMAALTRDGAIELVAKVERAKGFGEAIEVALPFLPPGVEMEGPVVVPPDQSQAVLRLFARPDADPASWRLAAEARSAPPRRDRREMTLALMTQLDPTAAGTGTGGRRRRASVEGLPTVCAPFVPLELSPAPIHGRLTPAAAEQGKTVTVACSIESDSPFPSMMMATLEGLPPRQSRTGRGPAGNAPVRVPGLGRPDDPRRRARLARLPPRRRGSRHVRSSTASAAAGCSRSTRRAWRLPAPTASRSVRSTPCAARSSGAAGPGKRREVALIRQHPVARNLPEPISHESSIHSDKQARCPCPAARLPRRHVRLVDAHSDARRCSGGSVRGAIPSAEDCRQPRRDRSLHGT